MTPELSRRSPEEDRRFRAISERDARADAEFVYAVKTTGIFCRPSCASRVPLPKNVEFFRNARDAERAGYRSCRRCRPTDSPASSPDVKLLVEACRRLSRDENAQSSQVARELGLTPAYFSRLFKRRTGVTPQEYRRRVIAERARRALSGASSVTEAAYAAGYSSSGRFYAGVARELGMRPSEARRGARGKDVRYAMRASSLGRLLVAWTADGICDVALGDEDAALVAELAKRFPKAALAKRTELPAWVADVVEAVESGRDAQIPLDIQGTAFQERVWRELRRIPPGETRTYREVALALGQRSSSSRAVARACASNQLAVVIPCHRVVRSDGDLSGYRWGKARKQKLLAREKKA